MAQRLLVLKLDKSVVPALQTMARGTPLLARFHALWTLEGLSALDAPLVREALKDPNPRMRVQAIRLSETLYKAGDRSFAEDYRAATKDADADVAMQALLTLNTLKVPDASAIVRATMEGTKTRGVQEIGRYLLAPPAAAATNNASLLPEQQQHMSKGGTNLHGALLRVSWHRRPGRAAGWSSSRYDHGAASGRISAGAGAPGLRHQGAATRPHGSAGGQDVYAGHDSARGPER